jgi:FlaA1/EpsC-like NDP-sugar epimerase
MEECPQIVFHAAAHKHVPLMELSPGQAVRNNVRGTRTVAEASKDAGVERFILISTDKAVNPVSVMGATKRAAELLVQAIARDTETRFLTVRFGNVLASNGSVVPRFLDQIRTGGPVTVTHPEMRRYFMIIPEAVQLVLHAASVGTQGGTYVLNMGDQIRVLDMARHLIRLAGYVPDEEIAIEFSGIRPGEKLFEELVGAGEQSASTTVDSIMEVTPRLPHDPVRVLPALARLESVAAEGSDEDVIMALSLVVDSFDPSPFWAGRHSGPRAAVSNIAERRAGGLS